MILKMKFILYQIRIIVFLLFLINVPNLNAHNLINGGCKEHCGKNFKAINNDNILNNKNDKNNNESKNSCLNKALCRG